ncbi:MAG: hypothetical protein QQN55_04505 [Nitrosopumilus sp.]
MALIKKKGFGFKRIKNEYKLVKANVPLKLANEVQNHFLSGFRKGGGQTDASIGGWKKRQTSRSARERKRSVGRALLVRSGKLRADIKKRKISFSKVIVGTRSIPYAGYINEGTSRMPQREFIGDSRILEKKIENKINREVRKIFKL